MYPCTLNDEKNNHTKMNTTYHKKECTEVTHSEESITNLKKKNEKNCKKNQNNDVNQ